MYNESMRNIKLILGVIVIVAAGLLVWRVMHLGVDIENNFGNKVVYTTSAAESPEAYQKDCAERGGTFHECGSPCATDAEICIKVCAYTCENISQ